MLALTRLGALNVLPPLELGGAANARIEAVAGIKALIVMDQLRLGVIQMAEVVFGWELRTASVQQSPHLVLDFKGLVPTGSPKAAFLELVSKTEVPGLIFNMPLLGATR